MTTKINVCFWEQSSQSLCADFSQTLHCRTSDFQVYANTGYVPANQPRTTEEKLGRAALSHDESDSKPLQGVLTILMQDNTGVESIDVYKYRLAIRHSQANPVADIKALVLTALREAGCEPVEVDTNGQPLVFRKGGFWGQFWRAQ
jgi:hypothetical protein